MSASQRQEQKGQRRRDMVKVIAFYFHAANVQGRDLRGAVRESDSVDLDQY